VGVCQVCDMSTGVFSVWNATEHHQFILGPPGRV